MKKNGIKANKPAFNELLKNKGLYEKFYQALETAMLDYNNYTEFAKAFAIQNKINLVYVKKCRTFIIDNEYEKGGFEPTLNAGGSSTRKPRKSGGSNLEKFYQTLNEFVATNSEFEEKAAALIDALFLAIENERKNKELKQIELLDKKVKNAAARLKVDPAILTEWLIQQKKATE